MVRGVMRRSLTVSAMLVIPAMVGLAAVSDTFIRLLLTDKWLPSVIFMQILCIGHAASALTAPNLVAIKAMGRSDIYMKLEFVRRVIMLIVLLITVFAFDTVEAMAYSFTLSSWIDVIICTIPCGRLLGYGFISQLRDSWKAILASAVMGAAVWAAGLLAIPLFLKLIVQIVTGTLVYIIISWLLKSEGFMYALNLLKGMKKA